MDVRFGMRPSRAPQQPVLVPSPRSLTQTNALGKGIERLPGGSPFLALYNVPGGVPGVTDALPPEKNWTVAHRDNAELGAVHALPIIRNKKGKLFVRLLVTRKPGAMGKLVVEVPGGLVMNDDPTGDKSSRAAVTKSLAGGDKMAKIFKQGDVETREETGMTVVKSKRLANQAFAVSPGAVTEMKSFSMVFATGKTSNAFQEHDEKGLIVGQLDVPLRTFQDYHSFQNWLAEQNRLGRMVGMDVLAVRGLLPPRINFKA